ncbi:C-X-C chemokine receptor type 5 [Salarias fasciatus]|uniref:G-protein coupled receptors family 1 profile domain-containing protein n=1 Tax=Salarias fasciatus TaxID=181472 RepID=A0A672FVG1_SALFA|nr:C-X-C chemokine receptor type 5 [Salarias fasciatus]
MDGLKTFTVFEEAEEEDYWSGFDDYNHTYLEESDTHCQAGLGLQTFYKVFKPVLYSLIFVMGVAGNGLMITVLLTRRRQLRITEIYLLHLALADLLLLFTLPFDVVGSVAGWLFGEFLCKLMGLLENLNILCGSFLMACIGFDRYLAIVHAIPSMQSRRPGVVHATCIVLWLTCLGLSVPNAVFLSLAEDSNSSTTDCFYYSYGLHAHNWVLTRRVLHHVCFFLPLAVMSYCYTALAFTLCKSQKSQTKKGAIRVALLVTVVFCVCWLPYNITLMVATLADLDVITYESCESFLWLQPVLDVTESLGISHCCLNPFLYAFVGVRFRNELIQLLCKLGCRRICLPLMRAQGHSRSSTSDGATSVSTVVY